MVRRYCFLTWMGILLAFFGADALAQSQVTLTPSMDNSLFEESGSLSNGAGSYLFVGNTNLGDGRRALVVFDVADALPEDAQIESVELVLNLSKTIAGSVNIDLHRITRSWGESSSNAPGEEGTGTTAASGDVTWTHAFYDTDTWQNAGGDFDASSSAGFAAGDVGSYTIESTPDLVEDVQAWVDDPESNFGWILIADDAVTPGAKRFDSREHPTESTRPQLTVSYSSTTSAENPDIPGSFVLEGNYPNPFSRSTVIRYELDRAQEVGIEVFDVTGRPVKTIARSLQTAGPHEVELAGGGLASGLYIYCLNASSSRACRTFTVLR